MRGTNEFFLKKVAITVGIEGKPRIETKVNGLYNKTFTLILVQKKWFVVCLVVILIIIGMFLILAKKTDMLRDSGLPPTTGRKPFSLSRMQMALWFIVIISSWLLLYVCLHRFNNLSESVLILMGITAGTGVGCVALDTNKTTTQCSPSRGFFTDLVSYNSGVSLFRFQNVAWTIVLILVFIRTVIFYLKMPDFDSTLLMLMGISSGTYIGGKVTEKKNEKTDLTE
jgi:magnesium-transporting ATPase (P-type)